MAKRIIYSILFFLILVDTTYSFRQHYSHTLDGDMASGIVPSNDVKPVLADPFGISVIKKNAVYPSPNRFFCQWTFKEYFRSAPLLLQKFIEPIDSIYLSCAIFKTIIQVLLIILIAMAITGTMNMLKMDFVIAAFLITPLFQTNGYQRFMGIIDPSITYTFNYAFPCVLLLFYFLPFIRQNYHKIKPTAQPFIKILWIPLAIIVSLSGPLNPGIVLVFSILVLLPNVINNYINSSSNKGKIKRTVKAIMMIPKSYWFYLFPICLFSIYSLYIGRNNSITIASQIPLMEMYLRLPLGIYYQFTQKLGFPILFLILTINAIIIHNKYKTPEGKEILNIFKWIGIFALSYIVLLPLGGCRGYRPNILRYDSIMPITLCLMFIFGLTTLFLLKNMSNNRRIWYIPVVIGVLFVFTISDEPKFDNNQCEKNALKEISESNDTVVELHHDCSVLAWGTIIKPEDSELNAQLLNIWGVTNKKKLYYNK